MQPFHLAFPVRDLEQTRAFYVERLGCRVGRESKGEWIDFDFGGHQLSAHLKPTECGPVSANRVDGDEVPVRHFGLVLPWDEWPRVAAAIERLGITPKELDAAAKRRSDGRKSGGSA